MNFMSGRTTATRATQNTMLENTQKFTYSFSLVYYISLVCFVLEGNLSTQPQSSVKNMQIYIYIYIFLYTYN